MKASSIKYGVLTFTLSLLTIILALMPFHAFLTVWGSELFGNYTLLRLWKEALVAVAAIGVVYLYIFDRKVRLHTFKRKLTWLLLAYLLVQIVWAWVAWQGGDVSLKAAAYGVLLNCRPILFFLLAWAIAVRTNRLEQRWPKLLLWPAIIVVVIGLLQVFVLPPDFLRHFGYGPDTINPTATINNNPDYLRYFSTLRGANPLGAYLLLPISALVVLLVRYPRSWNWTKILLLIGCLAMLFFSFSRSAWIGAFVTVLAVLIIASSRDFWHRYRAPAIGFLVAGLLVVSGTAFALRDSPAFQNFIFHTEDNSTIAVSSNDARADAIEDGFKDVLTSPLGHGPGTAGPASVYNTEQPGRISENYYLQIGQETGLIGLGLFAAIIAVIGYILWTRRQAPLAFALFAALLGISIINILSHAWTDDTLAYLWWGLAGISTATPLIVKDEKTE